MAKRGAISRRSFSLGAAAAAPFAARPTAGRADTTLRMSLAVTQDDPQAVAARRFAGLIEQKTKGDLHVEVFYNGTLAKQQESISGLQSGSVDFTLQNNAFLESLCPLTQALDLPFVFGDRAAAERVVDGELGKSIAAELAQKGILLLIWSTAGWREFTLTSKKVTRPEDCVGLRMRIQAGPLYVSMMKALGAIPVVIDISEVVISLDQKVIDGVDVPLASAVSGKMFDVCKYVALTNHIYNAVPMLMSKQRFDALPAAQQRGIQDAAREMLPYWRSTQDENQRGAIAFLRDHGVTVGTVDHAAFKRAMAPVYAEYRTKLGAAEIDRLLR